VLITKREKMKKGEKSGPKFGDLKLRPEKRQA
jgi:hypothetical protein